MGIYNRKDKPTEREKNGGDGKNMQISDKMDKTVEARRTWRLTAEEVEKGWGG